MLATNQDATIALALVERLRTVFVCSGPSGLARGPLDAEHQTAIGTCSLAQQHRWILGPE